MQKKTDILTRAVSTIVFTNSVFFYCVSLLFAVFAENTKIGVSAPKKQKNKNISKFYELKIGPSIR